MPRTKNRAHSLLYAGLLLSLVGCATASKDIAATYVPPIQYSRYDCDQLAQELGRVRNRVAQVTGQVDEAASNDKALTGVGVLLFWPALFALGGNETQEAELSRLKGEYEALQIATTEKKCST